MTTGVPVDNPTAYGDNVTHTLNIKSNGTTIWSLTFPAELIADLALFIKNGLDDCRRAYESLGMCREGVEIGLI